MNLPRPVKNLRDLWEKKKRAFEYTQVKAAKELGWTQGAFSQYLNNFTDLNDQAIIKLANFLDVDPNEIDPEFDSRSAIRWRKLPSPIQTLTRSPHTKTNKYSDNSVYTNAQLIYCDVDLPPIANEGAYLVVSHEKHISMQSRIADGELWGVYTNTHEDHEPWRVCPYVDIPDHIDTSLKRIVVSVLWL